MSKQNDVVLFLCIFGFDLESDRSAYEFLQFGDAGGFIIQQHVDDGLGRHHQQFLRIKLPDFAEDFAEDFVTNCFRRFYSAAAAAGL